MSERTKAIWLNFPSNPTAAVCDLATFEAAIAFAREHDLILLHDAAYSEITFDGYVAPSVLQATGAKDVALEFGSASKFYNMTGWRIGWVVGLGRGDPRARRREDEPRLGPVHRDPARCDRRTRRPSGRASTSSARPTSAAATSSSRP